MLASAAWRGPASCGSSNDSASVICWALPWSHLPSCSRQHPTLGVIKPVLQMRRPRQKGKELAQGLTVSQGVALGMSDSAALPTSLTGLRGRDVRPSQTHRLCHGPELPRQALLRGRCRQPQGGREGHPSQSCGWKRGAGVSPESKLPGGEASGPQGLWLAGARGAGSQGLEKPCFSLGRVPPEPLLPEVSSAWPAGLWQTRDGGHRAPDALAQRAPRALALWTPVLRSVSETPVVSWALAKGSARFASLGPGAGAAAPRPVEERRGAGPTSPAGERPGRAGPGPCSFPLGAVPAEARRPGERTGLTLVPRCLNEEPGPGTVTER